MRCPECRLQLPIQEEFEEPHGVLVNDALIIEGEVYCSMSTCMGRVQIKNGAVVK